MTVSLYDSAELYESRTERFGLVCSKMCVSVILVATLVTWHFGDVIAAQVINVYAIFI